MYRRCKQEKLLPNIRIFLVFSSDPLRWLDLQSLRVLAKNAEYFLRDFFMVCFCNSHNITFKEVEMN